MEIIDGPERILEQFSVVRLCLWVVVSILIEAGEFLRAEFKFIAQYGCEGYELRMA